MINEEIVKKLKEKYSYFHPLIFHRSVEHARDASELFEILDGFIPEYPLAWDEKEYRWKKVDK